MINWHDFLLSQSAQFDNYGLVSFTNPSPSPSFSVYDTFVTELCQYCLFFIDGADAASFLQGQMTADVREVTITTALATAFCSAKGRIISTAIIWKTPACYVLMLPRNQSSYMLAHLRKYIMFSKVSVEADVHHKILALGGSSLQKHLVQCLPGLPAAALSADHNAKISMIGLAASEPRWLCISRDDSALIGLWKSIQTIARPIGYPNYQAITLMDGWVDVDVTLREQLLPQMIGLETINGLSLEKGCFVGQEIIARTSHLGKLKRHLVKAQSSDQYQIRKGQNIVSADNKRLGVVVASAIVDERSAVLAVLADSAHNSELRVEGHALSYIKLVTPALHWSTSTEH